MDAQKIVENIQNICRDRGTNPTTAGKESGAGKDLVSSLKTRGVLPSIEKIMLLADYLGVTTSELLGEAPGRTSSGVRVPVLGTIPAGIPLEAIEDILDWEEIPESWASGNRQYFGLRFK